VIPGTDVFDVKDVKDVAKRLRGTISSKQYGCEELVTGLVARACVDVCPKNPKNFNVENVRVCKARPPLTPLCCPADEMPSSPQITGGGLSSSEVVQGLVIRRDAEGAVKRVSNAKVAVYGCAVDTSSTETKATVLIRSAAELEGYSAGEEARVEAAVKAIADTGVRVLVTGQSFGEMAMHFVEKYGIMALKIPSKFELRRFCRATNAVSLIKLEPPTADELGFVASCSVEEIGGTRCCVVRQADAGSAVTTVVLRGATENMMDDVERAVDDGVNTYKALARDGRLVAAGGAAELEVAARLAAFARAETGLDQYAVAKFAQALEVVPRTLAENAGLNATDTLSALYAAHAGGDTRAGVDIEAGGVRDLGADGLFDLFVTKCWAIRLASDAATTVLRVDQIISAHASLPRLPLYC
jgi:T-complex protein 1 subunit theta